MPMPVSFTSVINVSSEKVILNDTFPWNVNFNAFPIKLKRICLYLY